MTRLPAIIVLLIALPFVTGSKSADQGSQSKTEPNQPSKIATEPNRPAYFAKCDHVFSTYVDAHGLVDYKTLRRKRGDLLAAVTEFNNVEPIEKLSWSRDEKIAFWINAYNTFTLKLIIDNYPIKRLPYMIFQPYASIMHIPSAWTKNYFKVMGLEYTLREIEREILLARFRDPRICFTLSYASLGGAFLRNEAYNPENLDQQLDDQVKKYLTSPKGFGVDQTEKAIYLSNIFSIYKQTFMDSKYGSIKRYRQREDDIRSFLNFIADYIPAEQTQTFDSMDYTIKYLAYDWHLNEQR